jgi:hypothetical protein
LDIDAKAFEKLDDKQKYELIERVLMSKNGGTASKKLLLAIIKYQVTLVALLSMPNVEEEE